MSGSDAATAYLTYTPDGTITGLGFTPDGTIPAAAIACTTEQAKTWQTWSVVDGALAAYTPVQAPAATAAAAYAAFIANGLTVTSTANPSLSGVYAIDADSQVDIAAEAQFISTFSEFTTGLTTNMPWLLASGTPLLFPTMTSFLSFAKAVGQAVADAKFARAQRRPMPAASVTIP